MADDKDMIIDLDVPEDKKASELAKGTAQPGKAAEIKVEGDAPTQEAFDKLKWQLEQEKAGRAQEAQRATNAEANARKAMTEQERAAADTRSANLTMVTNAIESVKRENEILEANYAAALQGQDFTAAAKIQSSMGANAARLVQLETGKQAMEDEAKQAEERAKNAPKRPDFTGDPVEALASQLSPRSAQWIRAHPEYARDSRLMKKMIAAHNLVVDDTAADSDEYFEKVESILGITPQEDREEVSEASRATGGRSSAPPAAPVTRSGRGDGSRPNTITLTAAEREIAEANGMTAREYAEQKAKLIKEGRMH